MEVSIENVAIPAPWADLNERHAAADPFALFVEQFEQVAELLAKGTVAKDRMALVALDNLAEALLHRHSQLVFQADSGSGRMYEQRFSEKDYRRVADEFSQKVHLAQQDGHGPSWRAVGPILDAADAGVFLTAHGYRNRVYHEGRHNAALLPILTRAYMAAVARTFVRRSPVNVGSSDFPIPLEVLRQYGYDPKDNGWCSGFVPGEAAQAVAEHFAPSYQVSLDSARDLLARDLIDRADSSAEMLDWLVNDGLEPERLMSSIRWGDFWDQHGADDELVSLNRERMRLYAGIAEGDFSEEEASQANAAWEARLRALQGAFIPKVDLNTLDRVRRLAAGLSSAKSIAALVERYRNLDHELEVVEAAVDETAIGWDKFVQEQTDIAREESITATRTSK